MTISTNQCYTYPAHLLLHVLALAAYIHPLAGSYLILVHGNFGREWLEETDEVEVAAIPTVAVHVAVAEDSHKLSLHASLF